MPEDHEDGQATEHEPLLAKAKSAASYVETSASAGNSVPTGVEGNGCSNGIVKSTQQDGDTEQQSQAEDGREAQLTGLPEVRKQMKYILPAVGIGVGASTVW